jgi:hypothetical protein
LEKNLTDKEITKLYGIEFVAGPGKITQFGGVTPFVQYLEKSKIRARLETLFGPYKARSICQLLMGLVLGCEDFEEAGRMGKDVLVKKYVKNPVCDTQLARDFKAFTASELQAFHEFVMSLAITELAEFVPPGSDLEIDVDQTAVEKYGRQEGVSKGYAARDDITYCYQYLLFRMANLNTFLYGTIRDGSCHSQHGFGNYLRQFLPFFKGINRTVRLRADSGYFSDEAFDICQENGCFYYVKAPMSESRRAQALSPQLIWTEDPKNPKIAYSSYQTVTAKGSVWREVFKREAVDEDAFSLFSNFTEYRYDCVATNDMTKQECEVYSYYNQRANIENNIRELKNDYNLGSIVTKEFNGNDAITQTTLLTYVLVQHFKRMFLDEEDQRIQLSTLRWRVFSMVGRRMRGARKEWVRVYSIFLSPQKFLAILQRIQTKVSLLISPPTLAVT